MKSNSNLNSNPNSNPNQNSRFLTKQNLNLLWDVLLDELQIDANNKLIVTKINNRKKVKNNYWKD